MNVCVCVLRLVFIERVEKKNRTYQLQNKSRIKFKHTQKTKNQQKIEREKTRKNPRNAKHVSVRSWNVCRVSRSVWRAVVRLDRVDEQRRVAGEYSISSASRAKTASATPQRRHRHQRRTAARVALLLCATLLAHAPATLRVAPRPRRAQH